MSLWNFDSKKKMLSHLIGKDFGDNPEENMEDIRKVKTGMAELIFSNIKPAADAKMIEVGSGIGIMAEWMSHRISVLHCCDVSESFLNVAREECKDRENVSFHLLKNPNLNFAHDASIDAIYSFNVFIHLNLYDISTYFKEFQRVVKPGGKVWFDIANSDCLQNGMPALFLEMLGLYKNHPKEVALLICYNSPIAIGGIAKSFGFNMEVFSEESNPNLMLLFTKNS